MKVEKVAISVSESDNINQRGLTIYHLRDFIIELCRFLFVKGYKIIYGGNIKYNAGLNFAEVIMELARTYCKNEKDAVINYVVFPYCKNLKDAFEEYSDVVKFKPVPENCQGEEGKIGEYLSEMRRLMSNEEDARILAGGKTEGYSGKCPGLLEEAVYSLMNKKPLFLVGCFGGATHEIIKLIIGEHTEFIKFDIAKNIRNVGISSLNNGLNNEENMILFKSKNIYEIIFLTLKGLRKAQLSIES
jgi:hypothetical protein